MATNPTQWTYFSIIFCSSGHLLIPGQFIHSYLPTLSLSDLTRHIAIPAAVWHICCFPRVLLATTPLLAPLSPRSVLPSPGLLQEVVYQGKLAAWRGGRAGIKLNRVKVQHFR